MNPVLIFNFPITVDAIDNGTYTLILKLIRRTTVLVNKLSEYAYTLEHCNEFAAKQKKKQTRLKNFR